MERHLIHGAVVHRQATHISTDISPSIWTRYCVACQWSTAPCIKCRSIWKQVMERLTANQGTGFTDEMRMHIAWDISPSPSYIPSKGRSEEMRGLLTSSGSVSLNSQPSPVQLMMLWQLVSVSSSSRNCHSWMGPLPVKHQWYRV